MKIGDDRDPFIILGNIPELSAVFETKARAPYKIVFEVCRLSELIEETLEEERTAKSSEAGAAITDKPKSTELVSEEKKVEENLNDAVIGNTEGIEGAEEEEEKLEPEEAVFDESPGQPKHQIRIYDAPLN